MSLWFKRAFAVLVLAGVVLSSNLHLPLVQAVAWARMYEHYRVGYAPAEALEITFSGNAPCNLCKFVQAAQEEEHVLVGVLATGFNPLLPLAATGLWVGPTGGAATLRFTAMIPPAAWVDGPATPPPRVA